MVRNTFEEILANMLNYLPDTCSMINKTIHRLKLSMNTLLTIKIISVFSLFNNDNRLKIKSNFLNKPSLSIYLLREKEKYS